jgi:GAF domain-containing protein
LDSILAAHADPDQPHATFHAIDAVLSDAPGHILFTVLAHHPALRQSQRCYTNMPEAYPIGGRKPVTDSAWMQRVIHGGEPYIGRTRDDIAAHFFDHALIHSLGCESILNMPVRWRGQTLGTLNLCHRAGHYAESDLPRLRLIAQLAAPALLMVGAATG